MTNYVRIFLIIITLSSCLSKKKEDNNTSITKDSIICGRRYSNTMIAIEKFNDSNFVIYETPSYYHYADNPNIKTHFIDITEYNKRALKNEKQNIQDSITYSFSNDTLIISELFYMLGGYGSVPNYIKTDTSISINLINVELADTTAYQNSKELRIYDIPVAYNSKIVTRLVIDRSDRSKSIYYKKKKIK